MLHSTHTCNHPFVLAIAWLCILVCNNCWAQPPQGPPQGPPRGGPEHEFWSILKDASKDSEKTRRNVWMLLEHPNVRAEIKLSDADFRSFDELDAQHRSEIRKLWDDFLKAPDKQVCHKGLVERLNHHDAAFTQKLSEVANFQRLLEISVHAFGNRAVTTGEVATQIGLSKEKLVEIRQLTEKIRKDEFDKMGDKMRDIMRQNNQKIRDFNKQLEDKVNIAIKAKLTTEQLSALEKLKGAPFEVPEDLYGRGRSGRKSGDHDKDKATEDKKDNCSHCWSRWHLYI